MYYIQNNYGNTSGQIIVFPINIYPDMKFEYTHDDGEVEEAPITMGVNFFWPSNES